MGAIGIDITRPEAQAQPTGEFGVQVKPAGEINSQIGEVVPPAASPVTSPESTEIPVPAAQAELQQPKAQVTQAPPKEDEVVVVPTLAPEVPKDETPLVSAPDPVIVPAVEPTAEVTLPAVPEAIQNSLTDVQLDPTQPEVTAPSFTAADASRGRNRMGRELAQLTSEQAIQPEEKLINNPDNPAPATEPQIPLNTIAQVDQGVKNMEKLEADGTIPVAPLTDEDRAVLLANLQELQLPDGSIDKDKFYTMLQEKKDEAMAVSLSDPANDSKLEPRIANTVRSLRELGVNTFNKEMVKSIFAKKPQEAESPVAV